MANTINDLYLKYVNKVGKTLENDRYFRYLFEMVQAGNTTLQQKHRILHKEVDESWLSIIEESLDALNRITENPRRFVKTTEEVVPVELAKKITASSVRHLSMNTQFIASSQNGEIYPTRILNVTSEDTYDLYENRFVYHLIQRLVTFIDKRTDVIFWSTGDETSNTLKMHSKVDDAYEQIEYKLEMTVKNTQSISENDSDNMQVFMRIDRVRRLVMSLKKSAFCELMAGCAKVRSPIQRTNLITKDPDYRTCMKLWQFLESYDDVGYTIDARDSSLEFDEEYLLQLYSNMITNYTVFKSLLEADPRKLEDIPPKRRRVMKPKFIKKIEEQIVDDYDIPDVEIRKVIIEEVTQAQLDAEARLEEEIALRQAAEEARVDAEQALTEYRWQMDFQRAEAERQAEDRLNFVKTKAEEENRTLRAEMEAAQLAAEEKLTQTQAEAEAHAAALLAEMEAAQLAAEEKLTQTQAEAEAHAAALLAEMEAAQLAAEEKLTQTQAEAEAHAAALRAEMEAAQMAAEEKLTQTQAEAEAHAAALRAEMEAAQMAAEEKLSQTQAEAEAHAAALRAEMEAAQMAAEEKLTQTQAEADAHAAALRAELEAAQLAAEEKLTQTQAEAEAHAAALRAEMEAAQLAAEEKLTQTQAEAEAHAAALQAEKEAACRTADEKLAQVQAQRQALEIELKKMEEELQNVLAQRDHAQIMQQKAMRLAEKETKRRQAAEARAEENKLSRRILEAISQRRGEKDK